jgi:hypothetical protein
MRDTVRSIALAITIAAAPVAGLAAGDAPASSPPPAVDPAAIGQDITSPPPGSPADQALWRSGHEVTLAVQIERARATRLQTVLVSLRYPDRLGALAARDGEAGAKGAALQRRLGEAHATQFQVLSARWPVDTYRVCGYPTMEFGSMLLYGKSSPDELAKHRAMLVGCVDQARASLALMKEGNDGLEAAMKEVDAALVAAGLGNPGAAPRTQVATRPTARQEIPSATATARDEGHHPEKTERAEHEGHGGARHGGADREAR